MTDRERLIEKLKDLGGKPEFHKGTGTTVVFFGTRPRLYDPWEYTEFWIYTGHFTSVRVEGRGTSLLLLTRYAHEDLYNVIKDFTTVEELNAYIKAEITIKEALNQI